MSVVHVVLERKKVNIFYFPPKQPGFVGVCQSCQEEAPVGETPLIPSGPKGLFVFVVVEKGYRNFC